MVTCRHSLSNHIQTQVKGSMAPMCCGLKSGRYTVLHRGSKYLHPPPPHTHTGIPACPVLYSTKWIRVLPRGQVHTSFCAKLIQCIQSMCSLPPPLLINSCCIWKYLRKKPGTYHGSFISWMGGKGREEKTSNEEIDPSHPSPHTHTLFCGLEPN